MILKLKNHNLTEYLQKKLIISQIKGYIEVDTL